MKAVFRVDASRQIGTGHIMRCLTLADALKDKGVYCKFICRAHTGNLSDLVTNRGHAIYQLPRPVRKLEIRESILTHSSWLGVDWELDAAQTLRAIGDEEFHWLIVDHYGLDYRWERKIRLLSRRIMVIDDLADRKHDCNLLLDQNFGSSEKKYSDLLPLNCKQLHGSTFALLNPSYAKRRYQASKRDGEIRQVLIYFGGGADPSNLTGKAFQAFQSPELANIKLDIVVGSAYSHKRQLEEAVYRRGNATTHTNLPHLADLMFRADLAIGAAGATTWERCCMSLPTILVSCALNQDATANAVSQAGAALLVADNEILSSKIEQLVTNLMQNQAKYLLMSARAGALCDGLGSARVCKELING